LHIYRGAIQRLMKAEGVPTFTCHRYLQSMVPFTMWNPSYSHGMHSQMHPEASRLIKKRGNAHFLSKDTSEVNSTRLEIPLIS